MYDEDDNDIDIGDSDLSSLITSSVGVATAIYASAGSGTVPTTTSSVYNPIAAPPTNSTILLIGAAILIGGFLAWKLA
jgi:hypothetical protein